jgi:hypothetical protein
MEKKPYSTPELKVLGDVAQITQGQGWSGSSDTWSATIFGYNFTVNYGHS